MIICHCKVVNDAAITAAVDAGNVTLSSVCRETGAGTDCGGCVFAVKAIVCEHDVVKARTMDELRALSIAEETIRAAS